jgi:hypothetical protein
MFSDRSKVSANDSVHESFGLYLCSVCVIANDLNNTRIWRFDGVSHLSTCGSFLWSKICLKSTAFPKLVSAQLNNLVAGVTHQVSVLQSIIPFFRNAVCYRKLYTVHNLSTVKYVFSVRCQMFHFTATLLILLTTH